MVRTGKGVRVGRYCLMATTTKTRERGGGGVVGVPRHQTNHGANR